VVYGGIVSPEKINEYRKSIKFELIRANIAFSEFYNIAGNRITDDSVNENLLVKLKHFDSYARWCGHLYESLLALVIIETQNSIDDNSSTSNIDKEIQFEAKRALNRFNALVKAGKIDPDGTKVPTLHNEFSYDLRRVRNKCAFHCTNTRVKIDLLQNFLEKHHQIAYRLYTDFYNIHGKLTNECDEDFGLISEFFKVAESQV